MNLKDKMGFELGGIIQYCVIGYVSELFLLSVKILLPERPHEYQCANTYLRPYPKNLFQRLLDTIRKGSSKRIAVLTRLTP